MPSTDVFLCRCIAVENLEQTLAIISSSLILSSNLLLSIPVAILLPGITMSHGKYILIPSPDANEAGKQALRELSRITEMALSPKLFLSRESIVLV